MASKTRLLKLLLLRRLHVREAVFLTLLRFIVVLLLRGNHKKAALVREAAKQTELVARRLVGALWTGSEVAKKTTTLLFDYQNFARLL